MFARITDLGGFDRTFDVLDELRRHMNRVWEDGGAPVAHASPLSSASFPRFDVFDAGAELIVTADVPGLSEREIDVSLEDGVLTIAGERKVPAPEGYAAHRRERGALRFTRSLSLPLKVDAEKTMASVKDGLLTVTLAKAQEAKPRRIAVRVQ